MEIDLLRLKGRQGFHDLKTLGKKLQRLFAPSPGLVHIAHISIVHREVPPEIDPLRLKDHQRFHDFKTLGKKLQRLFASTLGLVHSAHIGIAHREIPPEIRPFRILGNQGFMAGNGRGKDFCHAPGSAGGAGCQVCRGQGADKGIIAGRGLKTGFNKGLIRFFQVGHAQKNGPADDFKGIAELALQAGEQGEQPGFVCIEPGTKEAGGRIGQPVKSFPFFQPGPEQGQDFSALAGGEFGFGSGLNAKLLPLADKGAVQDLFAEFLMAELVGAGIIGGPHEQRGRDQGFHRAQAADPGGRVILALKPLACPVPGLLLRPERGFMAVQVVTNGLEGGADGGQIALQGIEVGLDQGGTAGQFCRIGLPALPGLVEDMQVQGRGEHGLQVDRQGGKGIQGGLFGQVLLAERIGPAGFIPGKGGQKQEGLFFIALAVSVDKKVIDLVAGKGQRPVDIVFLFPLLQPGKGAGAQGADDPQPGITGCFADKGIEHAAEIEETIHLVDGIEDEPHGRFGVLVRGAAMAVQVADKVQGGVELVFAHSAAPEQGPAKGVFHGFGPVCLDVLAAGHEDDHVPVRPGLKQQVRGIATGSGSALLFRVRFFLPLKEMLDKAAEERTFAAAGLPGQDNGPAPPVNGAAKGLVHSALEVTLGKVFAHGQVGQGGGAVVTGPGHHQVAAALVPGQPQDVLLAGEHFHHLFPEAGNHAVTFDAKIDKPFLGKTIHQGDRLYNAAAVGGLAVKGQEKGIHWQNIVLFTHNQG